RAECRLLERTREEMVGRPVWEFVAGEDCDATRGALAEILEGQQTSRTIERKYLTASGRPLLFELHENLIYDGAGRVIGIRTAMLDITDRNRREHHERIIIRETAAREQAEAASAEIKNILERIGDAYIAFDTEWRYTFVNQKAAELARKPASELLGRCVWDEFPEAVHTQFYSELQRCMREQVPLKFDNYYPPLGKWFENSVYPSASGVGVFYRDITDRVATQWSLEKRTEELARKNAELETFAYVASHDLQEPLRMVSGYTTLLSRRYAGALGEDADEFLGYIVNGVQRMQRLIKDLLALCRLEGGSAEHLEAVSLRAVIDSACTNLDIVIEDSGAEVLYAEMPVVRFNETRLTQLMQNLIRNAIRYRTEAAPRITVVAKRMDGDWRVGVEDNGVGFDPRYADQIFEPFKRLQPADDGGTGIGLAICKKIVESRGGRIWAESVPGAGSTFWFTIPD
ncbi:MAG TPA: ATP-binding protein, partial [Bryobacteraceae bacterium]|nr:ATP-binding protein [Bryobacteraceae bacterium]